MEPSWPFHHLEKFNRKGAHLVKWPILGPIGSRVSEEIPYTRFDLQEFFDPDMEAPRVLLRSYPSFVDVNVTNHSQAICKWHGCRDDVKAIK